MQQFAEQAKDLLARAKDLAVQKAQELQELLAERQKQPEPAGTVLASTPPANFAPSLEARAQRFKQELLGQPINLENIKRLAFNGVPDVGNLRAVAWKLLLGYLPADPADWSEVLKKRRTQYRIFCDELIVDPNKVDGLEEQEADDPLRAQDVTRYDHPLSTLPTSKWNIYFKDNEIMQQVERDVMRTHPDMHFFTGETPEAELHRQEMKRALFMYAKLNPGLCYIQGMNELIAPLYYLFKNDTDPSSRMYAEADAFWCFMELISEFRDHFCQKLDNERTGIRATIRKLMLLLQHYDYELWKHIEVTHKVDPQFFAFRWITLLLGQEFAFPDVLRLWDTILSDPRGRMDCLLRVCVAMILNIRSRLMNGDFTVILKSLQRYPPVDVNVLLHMASDMPACKDVLGAVV